MTMRQAEILPGTTVDRYIKSLPWIAANSPDPSRKTACLIVLRSDRSHGMCPITACNDFPYGVTPRLERPARYEFIEHAERNAIYNAARNGAKLEDATMFLSWYPCADCARAIAQAGIAKLYVLEPDWSETRYGFHSAKAILEESGVMVVYYALAALFFFVENA